MVSCVDVNTMTRRPTHLLHLTCSRMLNPPRPEVILRQLITGASTCFCMYRSTIAPASAAVVSSLCDA